MTRYTPPSNKKPVHLVKHLHKVPEKKKVWPCIGDVKYDGVYGYGIIRPDDYRVFSRTGMQYTSLKHIETGLEEIHQKLPGDWVLIFEIYNDVLPVNTISGYCRDTKNQHPNLYCRVHDIIPYEDFNAGICTVPYIQRRARVRRVCTQSTLFVESESFHIRSEEKAKEFFERYTDAGAEGIVGRDPEGIWIAGKKNEACWKMKQELSFDLEVIDVEEGKGKYKGTLGKLVCLFRKFGKKDGDICEVRVSGMTDHQRDIWWNCMEEDPVGLIVKVDAMTYSKNGLLREPRFKEVREDKVEADF